MTKRLMKKNLVLLRKGWSTKIYKCPWIFHYNLKGYYTALKCHETLKKLFPNETYELKAFSFNQGTETEIPLNISDLK